jgi:hypothetical protein
LDAKIMEEYATHDWEERMGNIKKTTRQYNVWCRYDKNGANVTSLTPISLDCATEAYAREMGRVMMAQQNGVSIKDVSVDRVEVV